MKAIRILILEDDLETLSLLLKKLHLLEEKLANSTSPKDFSLITLSEYTQVEEIINKSNNLEFDVILLDRDCKAGGSFHVLDIERFGADKVISISSIPNYNEEAKARGITKVVWKDYQNLESFAESVIQEVKKILAREA
ncbi:MAG: hypothetical protein ACD_57C00079G0001 [uncultured bacterium]|nr:MAG: hypothetical protein ACD_57C00079G0001 [uncultured bacterium]